MASQLLSLGPIPPNVKLPLWLLTQLLATAAPAIQKFTQDPSGAVSRIGDVLVWDGPKGREVIAHLESLTESQGRIEQVVQHIESSQIGMAGTLGTLVPLSMLTLGVTSLTAVFMVWRMNALHRRLADLSEQISDIQAQLDARNQAHLETSLQFLEKYERKPSSPDLHTALEESTFATNVYKRLVQQEAQGKRRLVALNQCGRYYLLSLTAQTKCLVLADDLSLAEERLAGEKPTVTALARATFEEVMGKSPEVYLDPTLQPNHVTLDLLTEIYQQAHQAEAITDPDFGDAGQMFEHLRPRIFGAGRWSLFRRTGRTRERLLTKLKFLMACLEEVNRIESLRLRIADARLGKCTLQDVEHMFTPAKETSSPAPLDGTGQSVVAFGFA